MNSKSQKLRFPIVHLPLIFQSHKRNLPKSRHLVFFKGSMKTQNKQRLRTFSRENIYKMKNKKSIHHLSLLLKSINVANLL
jgi:hypothetical protein